MPPLFDEVERLVEIEPVAEDGGAADVHERHHEDVRPADVEERKLERCDVVGGDPPRGDRVDASSR